jgi:glucosyl-dolichyl phosphate glucuronosyltransferase
MTVIESPVGALPAVSVVICAHTLDRRRQLLAALETVRAQSHQPLEMILVVDHHHELLEWVRAHAPDVVAVENEESQGLAGARNTGVRAARGEVVAFLDDDAVADSDWVERLATAFRNDDVLAVGGAVLPVWEERPSWFPEEFGWVVGCGYRGLPLRRSPVRNVIGCNMSFRRDVFDRVGGFAESLGRIGDRPVGCEETEFCIRIGRDRARDQVLYEPAAAVHHHVPRVRATFRYFLSRCYWEGISKSEVARRTGRDRGLASERSYTLRTLPSGIWREIRAARLARAGAIVVGLCATVLGFLIGNAREVLARA